MKTTCTIDGRQTEGPPIRTFDNSEEMRPRTGSPGIYEADYMAFPEGVPAYGYFVVTLTVSGQPLTVQPMTLNRSGQKYIGDWSLADGEPECSWADRETKNASSRGIADFTAPFSRSPSRSLTLMRSNPEKRFPSNKVHWPGTRLPTLACWPDAAPLAPEQAPVMPFPIVGCVTCHPVAASSHSSVWFLPLLRAALFLPAASLLCLATEAAEYPSLEVPLRAIDAPEWDTIFKRTGGSGWYSGDGIFTVPFSASDTPGQKLTTKTLFLFSDSHICDWIDPDNGYRITGDHMVNHSIGILSPLQNPDIPRFSDMEFHWGRGGSKMLDAQNKNIFGRVLWAMDGMNLNGTISMFMLAKDAQAGVDMVHIPIIDDNIDLTYHEGIREATPFWLAYPNGDVRLGSAIMDNTVEGGAHTPDGYVYVYGVRKYKLKRGALVSRVRKRSFRDFSQYQFWNGTTWTTNFQELHSTAAEIFPETSSDRYSVTQIHTGPFAGSYMAIYSRKLNHPLVEYRVADTPVGPWSDGVPVWGMVEETDELGLAAPNFYGAKAHPHLSEPGELLVSYCVNCDQPTYKDHNKNRGRFFRIDLNNFTTSPPRFLVSRYIKRAASSGNTSSNTAPPKAFDANHGDDSKWQDDTAGDKWLVVDLGQPYYVDRWQLVSQGYAGSGSNLNTRDFVLQCCSDLASWPPPAGVRWRSMDVVTGNAADLYDNTVPETRAQYWRIHITNPSQDGTDIANVLSINLYGRTNPKGPDHVGEWLLDHGFTTTTDILTDSGQDNVSLLMEYALDLNPEDQNSAKFPCATVNGSNLEMTFYAGAEDVRYFVETSDDLNAWTTTGVTLSEPDTNGWRTGSIERNAPRGFLRLRIAADRPF